jgi:hypothetical protein
MDSGKRRFLGRIVRLQIQRAPLKQGEKPNRWYDPAGLVAVERLVITPAGAVAHLPGGQTLLDIHHAHHSQTRNMGGANDISLGFTSHYTEMRRAHGEHLVNGCAGENLLVEAAEPVSLADLAGGAVIRSAAGHGDVWLEGFRVAAPCREFSVFVARSPEPDSIKAALQFLDDGRRGFYCHWEGEGQAIVAVGDEIWLGVPGGTG